MNAEMCFVDMRGARSGDPDTSQAAAVGARITAAKKYCPMILRCLSAHPEGLTQKQISVETGIPEPTCSPCLRPMARAGIIQEWGRRINPETHKSAIVWTLGNNTRRVQ